MSRQVAAITAAVLVAIVAAGAVVVANGDGPYATRVAGRTASQETVDDELRVLAEHPTFAAGLINAEVAPVGRSLPATASSGWLTLRVITDVAVDELRRRGESVTVDDREGAALDGAPEFEQLPRAFRSTVTARLGAFRALQRVLFEDEPERINALARESCPSGRYVSHLLVTTLPEAQAAKREVDAGDDFTELARTLSIDTGSAEAGGDLGCLGEGSFVEPFQTTAATQALGVVSEPVQTEFGFHLILVSDELPPADVEAAAIEEILAVVRGTAVDIDPRYGSWDARSPQAVPPRSPAAAAPTP